MAAKLSGMAHSDNTKLAWLETDRFMYQFIEQAWDLFCVIDIQGDLLYASPSFERVVGFHPMTLDHIFALVDSEYRMDLHKLFIKTMQSLSSSKLEFRAKRAAEGHVWLECTAIPIKDNHGNLVQITYGLNDITTRKHQENRLIAMAYHDPLTGLPNRRLFKDQLSQMIAGTKRNGTPFALLYCDIDDFKTINDTMGHDVGDGFLQEFVTRIQGCLGDKDFFSRMGGDEFAILLHAIDSEAQVNGVAQRIVSCMEQPWEVKGHSFRATVSIGITLYNEFSDGTSIMKQVDVALYQVKTRGKRNFQLFQMNSMPNERQT
ncbi:sensor domain-containing diguanylate cyclase [Paenibacillus aestuarii]|uniref:Diguanylate cyclase domain-containing protein n=1 Tax=Paenibacillus aestuarii TaxID=516965 RepID=A0ABW0KBP6_9BACL|nr:sensor domain-containing diguanylate cyclase [Paenibacillus aestuarii]